MNFIDLTKSIKQKQWKWLIYLTIIVTISSLAFFYLLMPMKYVLLLFIWVLTLLLTVLILSRSKFIVFQTSNINDKIDYLIIGFSSAVLLINIFSVHGTELNLIVSEAVVFFSPGWFTIRLFGIDKFVRSWMAILIFSFIFSLGISALIFSLTVVASFSSNALSVSAIYLGICISAKLIKYRRSIHEKSSPILNYPRRVNLSVAALLIWTFLFFSFIVFILYPQIADVPGSDIIRHISASNELLRSTQLYNSDYPWFHFPIALMKMVSNSADWMIHTGTGALSIILIFSFYIMANRYLHDIDERAPILSTIFFFVFSGFGWLYFLIHSGIGGDDYFRNLSSSYSATYWDIGFGGSSWLWFWFRPLTVGFSILFASFFLLRNNDLPKRLFIPIMAFLVVVQSQTHISELVMFVGIIFTCCIFMPLSGLRLKETLIALLIGLGCSILVSNSIPYFLNSAYQIPQNITLLQLVGLTLVGIVVLKIPRKKFPFHRFNNFIVTVVVVFVYLVLVLSWLNTVDKNALQKISTFLVVPWEFYPVLLGVVGLLAIPGIFIALQRYKKHPIIIFIVLLGLSIFFGRVVSYLNLEIEGIGYWERRTVPFVFVSVSILCTVFILSFLRRSWFRNNTVNNIARVSIVGCLVLFGSFSTLLSLQYQFYRIDTSGITSQERQLQDSLKNIGPDFTILTLNDRASNIVEYYDPGYLIGYYKFQIWPSKSPELPLEVMSILGNKSAVYLNIGDYGKMRKSGYGDGFIASHMISMGEPKYSNQEGLIVLPKLVAPVSNSDLALVLADESGNIPYSAYSLLSIAQLNYTTVKISDLVTLNKSKILVAPTEEIGLELENLKNRYNLGFQNLITLNLDGYEVLTRINHSKPALRVGGEERKWTTQGINKGSIGTPLLSIENSKEGDIVTIQVGNGSHSLWQIYQKFQPPIDLANYDLFNFDWYGKNDSKYYIIEFYTQAGGAFWYRFQDLWNGWKKVSLPMHLENGTNRFFGEPVDAVTTNNIFWHNITRLNIRTESSNLNNIGTFNMRSLNFETLTESSGIESLSMGKEKRFPSNIKVVPINAVNQSSIMTNYKNTTVPYLTYEKNGTLSSWYVNIYPITSKMSIDSEFAKLFYPHIGDLLPSNVPYTKNNNSQKDIRTLVGGGVVAFRSLNQSGKFQAVSESAIMIPQGRNVQVTVDNNHIKLDGIKNIAQITGENSVVKGTELMTEGGYGFYLSVNAKNASVSYYGHPARVLVKDNDTESVLSGENITFKAPKSTFVMRQPIVSMSGSVIVQDLYAYGNLNNKLRSLGNDIKIIGNISFVVESSDEFTVVNKTTITGQFSRDPPLYFYDDLDNLAQLFNFQNIRHIIAISFILILIAIFFNPKKARLLGKKNI